MRWISEEEVQLLRGGVKLAWFWRIMTDTPGRLHLGVGDKRVLFPGDPPDALYAGAGGIAGLPDLSILHDGQAEEVAFALAAPLSRKGAPEAYRSVYDRKDTVRGREVSLGWCYLDRYDQPVSRRVVLFRKMTATGKKFARVAPQDNDPGRLIITLTCSGGHAGRSRPQVKLWSDAEHQAAHAGDKFFERTGLGDRELPSLY